jgi:hypothetical protein
MRGGNHTQDRHQLADSISDLGYEFIGTDGEDRPESVASSYDHQTPELGDDVQSLADTTDLGTDAETNDVTDSSDDEMPEMISPSRHSDLEDSEATAIADRSLELPTQLFRQAAEQKKPSLYEKVVIAVFGSHGREDQQDTSQYHEDHKTNFGEPQTLAKVYGQTLQILEQVWLEHREGLVRALCVVLTILVTVTATQYFNQPSSIGNSGLTAVPVAQVSSVTTSTPKETFASPISVVTSSATTSLQTSLTKALTHIGPSQPQPAYKLYSIELLQHNQVSFKVASQHKSIWQSKRAVSVSVFRGEQTLPASIFKISPIDDGFVITIPRSEAYGILDFSVNTTRKPRIDEIYRIQLGSYTLVNALGGGKELVDGFARSVVDTANDTTQWVEEKYLAAVGALTKQATAAVPTNVTQ